MSTLNSNLINCTNTTRLPILTTAQINALTNLELGTMVIDSTLATLRVYRETGWQTLGRIGTWNATGGTIISSGGFNYHVFTAPGTFTINSFRGGTVLSALLIGGGGSGGNGGPPLSNGAGGGGAGGVVSSNDVLKSIGNISVIVGNGGVTNSNGENSSVVVGGSTVTAFGGGRGGTETNSGVPGGSGGGGHGNPTNSQVNGGGSVPSPGGFSAGSTFWSRLGGNGGNGAPSGSGGGGGGGGGSGGNGTGTRGGTGGLAHSAPGFSAPLIGPAIPAPVRPVWLTAVGPTGNYAGGGGGGQFAAPDSPAPGGGGGAGRGAEFPGVSATAAVNCTGSGGGGGTRAPVNFGGSGGSGIVIFSYPTT